MAREVIHHSYYYFGSWQYIRPYYYNCYGSEASLSSCNYNNVDSYYCNPYDDEAGVRCTGPIGDACSEEGDVRLVGGSNGNEGNLEYCYSGAWTHFCHLDDEEATVACKQLGHYQYKRASILSQGSFSTKTNYSLVSVDCSSTAVEYKLSDCSVRSSVGSSSCAETFPTCSNPVGIRCYDPGTCTEGAVRLANGVLEQEGRVEVCVNGVWGSICGDDWNKIDGYIVCKEAGFDDAEPMVYSKSKFGDGYGPIVYSYVQCNGWEKSIGECPKYEYLQFSCSRSSVAGVLCHDDCKSGDVRLIGGNYDWEGTVEVCYDRLWGTIADSGWDNNDAAVICRQLGYSANGVMSAVLESFYDKPNKTVHFTNMACLGNEQTISQCSKSIYSLQQGKFAINNVEVAGVQCLDYISPTTEPCLSAPDETGPQCNESDLQLIGGSSPNEGRLEFCYRQQWSPFCTLHHIEASVACKQLGYTQYTWAAIITSGEFGSNQNYSLFDNITCSDTASEYSLERCTVNVGTCLSTCTNSIGIRCFEYGTCTEGDSRIVDGLVAQEGRVEVCVSGVWGSVCSTGWDTNDANVVCRQLGFPGSKPIPYYSFGAGSGPVVYANMDCIGWENSLSECTSESYLDTNCPPLETAGVFCADYCFAGEIRLIGGDSEAEGTVEICFDNLWGLIDESGWGLNDARVVCEQLGYGTAGAQPVYGSLYGKPKRPIHASGVFCLGDEEELIECSLTMNSLNDGRLHLDDAQVAGVSCSGGEHASTPPSVLMLASNAVNMPETPTACVTTIGGTKTTIIISAMTTVTEVISSVSSVTATTIITSTASTTFYSTLTTTSVSSATLISTDTITQHSTSTVTATDTTTKLSVSTITSTSTKPVPTTVYITATDLCTGTCTTTQTFTAIVTETSTATTVAATCTAKPASTRTITSYISHPGSSLLMNCSSSPQPIADSLATATFSGQTQTASTTPATTNTVGNEPPAIKSSYVDEAGTTDESSNSSGSSSTVLIAVALAILLTAIIVLVGVAVVVLIVKKHTKKQLPSVSSSGKVDNVSVSAPKQCQMQESAQKKLTANEERKDDVRQDQDSLEAPQDHSDNETGV